MIYFMQSVEGGPVKIGYTDNLEARHKQLEKHYRVPLAILATLEGGPEEEAEIHRKFHHLRLDGYGRRGQKPEQFRPTSDLMEFIGRPLLVALDPDAVELMPPPKLPDPTVSSVKMDRALASMAKVMARDRGITVAAFLGELLDRPVKQAYAAILRERFPQLIP